MIRHLLLAAAVVAVSAPAFAAEHKAGTAKTFEKLERIVADGSVWFCKDATCTADVNRSKPTVRGCRKAAKKLGALTSFGTADAQLSAEELEACNTSAK